MLDYIRSLFKKEFQLSHCSTITAYLHQITLLLEASYTTDKDAKNAAIDAVCKLLQEYKDPQIQGSPDGQIDQKN
jgi:hypothetical protein